MIRLVMDTNQLIAGFFWSSGPAAYLLDVWRSRKIGLIVTPAILSEFEGVVVRDFGLNVEAAEYAKKQFAYHGIYVDPSIKIVAVKQDTTDNIILEAAVEGRADYIVTRDKHLLRLGSFQGIPISPPEQIIKKVGKPV